MRSPRCSTGRESLRISGDRGRAAPSHQVLTNEKYIGNNVLQPTFFQAEGETHKDNPREEWVRADGAFEAIVDPQLFFIAQGMIRERKPPVSPTTR